MLNARDDIIDLFKKGIFPYKGNIFKTKEEESEENNLEKIKDDYKKFFNYIEDESKGISYELFEKHFHFVSLIILAKKLYKIKNEKEKNELVNVVKSGIIDLKYEIKKMSGNKKRNEKPDKTFEIVEEILEFNREKQSGLGLKI